MECNAHSAPFFFPLSTLRYVFLDKTSTAPPLRLSLGNTTGTWLCLDQCWWGQRLEGSTSGLCACIDPCCTSCPTWKCHDSLLLLEYGDLHVHLTFIMLHEAITETCQLALHLTAHDSISELFAPNSHPTACSPLLSQKTCFIIIKKTNADV